MIAKFARLEFELLRDRLNPTFYGFINTYFRLLPAVWGLKYLEFDPSVKGIIKRIHDTMLLTAGTVINAAEQSMPQEHDGRPMIRINVRMDMPQGRGLQILKKSKI